MLSEPGNVDLSAHVDFSAIARVARGFYSQCVLVYAETDVGVLGPISQDLFLSALGIYTRVEMLVHNLHRQAKTKFQLGKSEDLGNAYITPELQEKVNQLVSGATYLIDPSQMGELFKVMVIIDPKLGLVSPFEEIANGKWE